MPGNLGAAIYGLIIVGALLAAESVEHENYAGSVVSVVLTLILYWLAHSYAEFASWRLEAERPISLRDLGLTMVRQFPILLGAAIPLAALLICWALSAPLSTGVSAALWTAGGTILLIELVSGIRSKQSGPALILQVGVGAMLGVLIAALKLILR